MGLPNREAVLARLTAMLSSAAHHPSESIASGDLARPTVCVIAIDGYDGLVELDGSGVAAAMDEIGRRLDRLVRASDVLGRLGPDRFVLVAASLAPAVAGHLVERIGGAVAMPIELGGQPISIGVTVGVAFAERRSDAAAVLQEASDDVDRIRSRR
jgi:GGDEF domain-containing protein